MRWLPAGLPGRSLNSWQRELDSCLFHRHPQLMLLPIIHKLFYTWTGWPADGGRLPPDPGDVHIYTDQDPTWYGHRYKEVPYISETGIYNMPEPESFLQVIDAKELKDSFGDLFAKEYVATHPEIIHHMLRSH